MAYNGSAFPTDVLNSTNYFRELHSAKDLTWNSSLAQYAQSYAENCIWRHSGGPYGENLAAGFATSTAAVDAWGNEESMYHYMNPGFSEKTGHFTQLVWQSTTSVGCGVVLCDNDATGGVHGWYLVCEYYPPGNVIGDFRNNVDPPNTEGTLGLWKNRGDVLSWSRNLLVGALLVSGVMISI